MKIPQTILRIMNQIQENKQEVYLVGGCVRDLFLNQIPHDYDLCTNASIEELQSIFSADSCILTGIKHGTITVHAEDVFVEITIFKGKDILTDLSFRDFTMNAMAMSSCGTILDPFHGQGDIKNRTIRCVNHTKDRLCEDPLRMLRAIRFSCQFDFELDETLMECIQHNHEMLHRVSSERIREEFTKILMWDAFGLKKLYTCHLLQDIDESLSRMFDCKQENKYHFTDVGMHTCYALDAFLTREDELNDFEKKTILFALLLHDVGKPDCKSRDAKGDHFYGHPKRSVEIAQEFLEVYKFSNSEKKRILTLIEYHDTQFSKKKKTLRKILIKNKLSPDFMKSLFIVKRCDALAHVHADVLVQNVSDFEMYFCENLNGLVYRMQDLAIDGNDILQSTHLKNQSIQIALDACLDLVFYHPEKNTKDSLLHFVKKNERRFLYAG